MADLASGGVVGAAFGEGFAILHDTVKHVVGQIIMFKSELKRLESTLDGVAPMVREIEELSQALNFPVKETQSLVEQMKKGKELVLKCSKIKRRNWNYCVKAYSYSNKLSKLNKAIEKFCQVNLIVQNTRNGLETLTLVSQNTKIGLKTLTEVNQNTGIGLDTLAEVNHNTTIGLETLAEVNHNTRIGLETLAELNQNTTIGLETLADVNYTTRVGLETLAEVNHNTRIGLETLTEVNENKRALNLVLKHVESQNSNMKKKYGTSSCAVPKLRDYIVGFDLHLKELKRGLLKEEVSVLIVTALGGCGKTTLVKMLGWDEEIIDIYMGNIFFVNVSKTPNLKVIVQNLFSYNGDECPEFQSDEDAINQLEQLLYQIGQPILLILDDVWPESESLIDKFKCNIPNYKIVVTSRKAFSRFKFRFQLNPLAHEDAMRLFCHSASMQVGSSYILEEDMEKIVRYCGGLPIALEVIGGSLCGQPVEVWQSKVMGWSEGHSIFDSDNEVLARLQKCLDFSADKIILKEYFMDLGSFPEDQRIPATALIDVWTELHESSKNDVHAIANLHELNSRNLASLVMKRKDAEEGSYYYNEEFVTQHDLLRELAIQLSSQKPIIERTRLIVDIRENNLPDWWMKPQLINARLLSISTDEQFSSSWCNNIQAPEVEALILNFRTRNYTLPEFVKNMVKLKVMIVTNYGFFPAELSNFQLLSSLPNLKRIRLEKVSFSSLCNTLVQLRSLKKISLFMCNIGQTFGNSTIQVSDSFPNLMEINIDYCNDLVELPTWLCEFLHLKKLNITNCHKLSELPEEIGKLVNLEELRLRSCTELSELPESTRSLHKLRILDISDCLSIIKLPKHIGELHKLKELHMKECLRLRKQLPSSIIDLKQLRLVVCDEERAKLWEPFEEFFSNLKVMKAKKDINLNWLSKS
ncbi:probable disease resistance protein At5g66900 [Quercus robur]|uniref:probable disease resistance protein At5g66900 n=1 Tax=Quercus robur TaxID=38942 RepID=UPI002162717A|nr:probable disease resistance protein At5g66900 [Quercus robur]